MLKSPSCVRAEGNEDRVSRLEIENSGPLLFFSRLAGGGKGVTRPLPGREGLETFLSLEFRHLGHCQPTMSELDQLDELISLPSQGGTAKP